MKYHLFQSKQQPDQAITIGEYDNGTYFIPAAQGLIPDEENVFISIEDIEKILNDELVMLRPKEESPNG